MIDACENQSIIHPQSPSFESSYSWLVSKIEWIPLTYTNKFSNPGTVEHLPFHSISAQRHSGSGVFLQNANPGEGELINKTRERERERDLRNGPKTQMQIVNLIY